MGFQALFKFVKCWRAPDVVRETVASSWGGNGLPFVRYFHV